MVAKPSRVAVLAVAVVTFAGCSKKDEAGGAATSSAAAGAKAQAAKSAADDVVARVNGTAISRSDFDAKYNKMTRAFTTRNKEIPENLARRYKESILKQLVERELLNQKIASAGVKVEPAELDKEFDEYKKMFRTDENFDRYLKSSDVTVDQIKDNISHNIAVNKLLEKVGNMQVTDEELKDYYDKNQKRYEIKEQVRASHILLKLDPKADKKTEEQVHKKALDIYKEASKKDADFAELAKKYSQGPTASRGGDLSYFPRGRMVPEFEEVAFKMKPGEISKPVRTQFGWHIIKLVDHKEGRQRPFEEVHDSIEKLLKNKKSREAKQSLLKQLRTEAKIETFLPDVQLDKPQAAPTLIQGSGASTGPSAGHPAAPGSAAAPASVASPTSGAAPASANK